MKLLEIHTFEPYTLYINPAYITAIESNTDSEGHLISLIHCSDKAPASIRRIRDKRQPDEVNLAISKL